MTGHLPPATMDLPPTPLTPEQVATLLGPAAPGRRRGTTRMARTLVLRYGTDPVASRAEIAALLGITRERVRQVEAKGLRTLAHPDRVEAVLDAAGRETRLGAAVLGCRARVTAIVARWEGGDAADG